MAGGGSGGGTTTTTRELSPEQQMLLNLAIPASANYFNTDAQGNYSGINASVYPGATTAGINPLESIGQQMVVGQALGSAGQASETALGGLNFLTSGNVLDVNNNPAIGGAVDAAIRPLTENYQRNVLPGIRDQAVLSGAFGDSRHGVAEGIAASDYMKSLGDVSANMISDAYGQGLDSMTRSFAFAPQVIQAGYSPATAIAGVGAQQRAFDQAQINEAVQRFYQEQFLPLMLAQEISGMAFGIPSGTSTVDAQGGGTPGWMGALGGAASGAALGSAIFPGIGTGVGAVGGALLGLLG